MHLLVDKSVQYPTGFGGVFVPCKVWRGIYKGVMLNAKKTQSLMTSSMNRLKIKIVILGYLPFSINLKKVYKWKSELFEILPSKESEPITSNSDGRSWFFLDQNIEKQLPSRDNADILIAVTNVPLQENYFARSFSDNRVCMTYDSITEILENYNIPLENLILRRLYTTSILYKRHGNRIPLMTELVNDYHDETRKCLFDMNGGKKSDIIFSLDRPQLCPSCVNILTNCPTDRIDKKQIDSVQRELKKIKKGLYYKITDLIKQRPILSIAISSLIAIILGAVGSIIATLIWEKILK